MLAQICRGKRVVLVSATPLNNTPQDILSQIKLFQPGRNSTIPNVRNLEAFFGALQRKLKGLDRQRDRELYFKIVQENARETREKVLKFLMIRRTRTEIQKYYGDDLHRQGMKFPEVANPEPLFYKFSAAENDVFDQTMRSLANELKYARYTPLLYYTGHRDIQRFQSQINLAKFMKILAVKRLESSFTAFLSTLNRFIQTYERVIAEFHKGHGADARLLTEGEEIVSHDLFAKWNSKKTITGEDEEEESELEFLTEIRAVRDEQPELFERIKRLPKKARSSRTPSQDNVAKLPALLTYFRQGKLDKFFLGADGNEPATELDFMSAAKILKPVDPAEPRQIIPKQFYELLERNKAAFVNATAPDAGHAASTYRGSPSDAYILKRLKDKAVSRCPQFTEDDEEFVANVIRLVEDGALPKPTSRKVSTALKKAENLQPLKVLGVLRREIKREFFQASPAAHASQAVLPREVTM